MTITEYHNDNLGRFPKAWQSMTGGDVVASTWDKRELPLLYDFLAYRGWLDLLPSLEIKDANENPNQGP